MIISIVMLLMMVMLIQSHIFLLFLLNWLCYLTTISLPSQNTPYTTLFIYVHNMVYFTNNINISVHLIFYKTHIQIYPHIYQAYDNIPYQVIVINVFILINFDNMNILILLMMECLCYCKGMMLVVGRCLLFLMGWTFWLVK